MRPHVVQLAEDLKNAGIQYAFGVTGGGASLQLITELEKKGINYIPVAHEAAAPIMAGATCADGTMRAVAISIKGPGFVNMIPGITLNYFEARPALSISEAYDPSIKIAKVHKKVDQQSIVKSLVKQYTRLSEKTDIAQLKECAELEVPGPVHIDMCNDPAESDEVCKSSQDKKFEELSDLKQYKQPVLILGSLAARKFSDTNWSEFKIPICTTAAAKGVINETGDYAGGVVTGEIKELSPESTIVAQADCVIAIGLRCNEVVKPTDYEKPTFILDVVSGDMHDGFNATEILANKENIETIKNSVTSWGKELCETSRTNILKETLKNPWMPAAIFNELNKHDVALTLDTGIFCTVGETLFQAKTSSDFIGSAQGRFMGTAIPTAIGHALHTKKHTVCVVGDGGIMPYVSEIATAVEKKLPILFILMSDGGYGACAPSAAKLNAPEHAYERTYQNIEKIVEGVGCPAKSAANMTDVETIMQDWRSGNTPLYLELHFEKNLYRSMTQKLR